MTTYDRPRLLIGSIYLAGSVYSVTHRKRVEIIISLDELIVGGYR